MATSPETGDPAATLEEVRENSQDASYTLYGPGMAVISRRDLSALLAALEAALNHHQPVKYGVGTVCQRDRSSWPCPEVAAVRAELLREAGDAGT